MNRFLIYIVMLFISWLGYLFLINDFNYFKSLQAWSMILGYLAFLFLSLTLLVGAIQRLFPSKFSTALLKRRRDIGIWTGLLAILHIATVILYMEKGQDIFFIGDNFSSNLHGWPSLFFSQGYNGGWYVLYGLEGFANYIGLLGFILLSLLWLTSSDKAQKLLGSVSWRRIHSLSLFIFILIIFHATIYVNGIKGSPHSYKDFFVIAIVVLILRWVAFIKVTTTKPVNRGD